MYKVLDCLCSLADNSYTGVELLSFDEGFSLRHVSDSKTSMYFSNRFHKKIERDSELIIVERGNQVNEFYFDFLGFFYGTSWKTDRSSFSIPVSSEQYPQMGDFMNENFRTFLENNLKNSMEWCSLEYKRLNVDKYKSLIPTSPS